MDISVIGSDLAKNVMPALHARAQQIGTLAPQGDSVEMYTNVYRAFEVSADVDGNPLVAQSVGGIFQGLRLLVCPFPRASHHAVCKVIK
jgi:hypothetical protein